MGVAVGVCCWERRGGQVTGAAVAVDGGVACFCK